MNVLITSAWWIKDDNGECNDNYNNNDNDTNNN